MELIYSNCAVIGHFTCQTAMSMARAGCHIVTRPFPSGRVGFGHETSTTLTFGEYLCKYSCHIYTVVKVGGGIDPATEVIHFGLN